MDNMGNPELVGKMLLVSPSSLTMYQLARTAHRFAMSVEVCTNVGTALDLVNKQKFDAVAIDLSLGQRATAVLQEMRLSASRNRTAVSFAISGSKDESTAALRAGSSFILEKPLTFDSIRWTLQAAHGLILRERRRYFRCLIALPVSIQQHGMRLVCGETVNISEGGIALRTLTPLTKGAEGKVQFTLPGAQHPISAEASVCWYNEHDQAGLSFRSLSPRDSSTLQEWLARRFEEQLAPRRTTEIKPGADRLQPILQQEPVMSASWCDLT